MPMAKLSQEMVNLGFEQVSTLLNSGNVIFSATGTEEKELEIKISTHLESVFGFPIPVLLRQSDIILNLIKADPFTQVDVTPATRLYISFLKEKPATNLVLPWTSQDSSFRILDIRDRTICSVLDLAVTATPKGMDALEQLFGKNITTRNWNTIQRIAAKVN